MSEIKPRETVNAMKIIEDNFTHLIKQIETLERKLELTEKRALEWEQMHLDELEQRQELQKQRMDQTKINTELNQQNNELRKQLGGAQAAIRDQVERNMVKPEVMLADRMEKTAKDIAREEFATKSKQYEEDVAKRDAHNAIIQKNVEKQSGIMAEGLKLHHITMKNNDEHLDLVRRSVKASEKQTLLMENMSACMGEIVIALNQMVNQRSR